MAFPYEKYLRNDKLPLLWCPGCGDGIILKAILRAIDRIGWSKDDIAMVSGIGCSSRLPGYVDFNTLHTTHGRALAFATGVKMAKPDKHVIVVTGDGDALAIGGNHFIHTCRRNINITVIVINNNIYGMTGGQFSPTTPEDSFTSTTPYGNIDPAFNVTDLAISCGATFVARETVAKGILMSRVIEKALLHNGVSVVDAVANCHTQYGRKNKLGDAIKLINSLKDRSIPVSRAQNMSKEELKGKLITGVLHKNDERPEYTKLYQEMAENVRAGAKG